MRRHFFFMAVALLILTAPAFAATPPAAVMAPINAALAATNADKIGGLDAYYTSGAVVSDEFPPYSWSGPTAASQWWSGLDKLNAKMGVAKMRATAEPVKHFSVTGNNAYVVLPLNITFTAKGKPQHETGLLAITLQRSGGSWKIATQSWATISSSM